MKEETKTSNLIVDQFINYSIINLSNLSIINILPNRVTDIYIKLKSITSKLYDTSASIAFIKKALFDVIPKYEWWRIYQLLLVGHFSLTFVNLSLAWMLYIHVWIQNNGKFVVWSEYYDQFGIYQLSRVSLLELQQSNLSHK